MVDGRLPPLWEIVGCGERSPRPCVARCKVDFRQRVMASKISGSRPRVGLYFVALRIVAKFIWLYLRSYVAQATI